MPGPLFVLGPFVLAGDGLRGGAFVMGAFRVVFSFVGKIMLFSSFFGLVGSEGENVFWITARLRTVFWCVVVVCLFFVRFLGLSLFF